jgi:uncharacterized protein
MKNYKKFLGYIIGCYAGFIILLTVFQNAFIYHPQQIQNYDIVKLNDMNAVVISDNNLQWLYLPTSQPSNKILVYFHGNAGMAIHRVDKANIWRDNGFNVVLAEYPGYGTNSGKLNEQTIYNTGRVTIDKTKRDFPNHDLYIYGESIGSGVAVQMATEYDEKALIIEGGFSSLGDIVKTKMPFIPVSLMLRDNYDNISKINNINSRLILLHGAKDSVIPLQFGQKLFDAYIGQKDIRIFNDAGHNDIYTKIDMNDLIKDLKL